MTLSKKFDKKLFTKAQLADLNSDAYYLLLSFYQFYIELREIYRMQFIRFDSRLYIKLMLPRIKRVYNRLKRVLTVDHIEQNPYSAQRLLGRGYRFLMQLKQYESMSYCSDCNDTLATINSYRTSISGVYQDTVLACSVMGAYHALCFAAFQRYSDACIYVGKHVNEGVLSYCRSLSNCMSINDKDLRVATQLLETSGSVFVVVEVIGEGIAAGAFPLDSFLKRVKQVDREDPFYLIIGENNVGELLQPARHFSRRQFPHWFHLIVVRDLSGMGQYGMGLRSVVSITSFDKHRRDALSVMAGLELIGQLFPVNQWGIFLGNDIKRRDYFFSRYHRNGLFFYRQCLAFQAQFSDVITEVKMPGYEASDYRSLGDVYFRVNVLPSLSMSETLILIMSDWESKYELRLGKFNKKRICSGHYLTSVVIGGKNRQVPYLRISPGMEDLAQFELFTDVLFLTLKNAYNLI